MCQRGSTKHSVSSPTTSSIYSLSYYWQHEALLKDMFSNSGNVLCRIIKLGKAVDENVNAG